MIDTDLGAAKTRAPTAQLYPYVLTAEGHYRLVQVAAALNALALVTEAKTPCDAGTLSPVFHVLAGYTADLLEREMEDREDVDGADAGDAA